MKTTIFTSASKLGNTKELKYKFKSDPIEFSKARKTEFNRRAFNSIFSNVPSFYILERFFIHIFSMILVFFFFFKITSIRFHCHMKSKLNKIKRLVDNRVLEIIKYWYWHRRTHKCITKFQNTWNEEVRGKPITKFHVYKQVRSLS